MKYLSIIIFVLLLVPSTLLMPQGAPQPLTNAEHRGGHMIVMRIENEEFLIHLFDNPTSRDLLSMLPLNLVFKDYANTEKIAYPTESLSTEHAPEGYKPSAGDLTLYAPWGNLALFYRDFSYSMGLIPVGRLEEGIEKLKDRADQFEATLELRDDPQ